MDSTTEGDFLFYYKFLDSVVESKEDKDKLHKVLYESGNTLPMSILEDIVKWLGEEFSKEPSKS